MATLTWKEVSQPSFNGAASMLKVAADSFSGGADGLGDAMTGFRDVQKDQASALAAPILARVASEGDVNGAIARLEGLGFGNLNDATRTAAVNMRGAALGYDTRRLDNSINASDSQIRVNEDGRAAVTHERDIRKEDQAGQLAQAQFNSEYGTYYGNDIRTMDDRELGARLIMAEAGNQGDAGMAGVGSVFLNRLRSGKYGGSLRDVMLAPGQFSATNGYTKYAGGQQGQNLAALTPSAKAYEIMDQILEGTFQDTTNGATHYYNDQISNPDWGQAKAGGSWVRQGDHLFGTVAGGSKGMDPALAYNPELARNNQAMRDVVNQPGWIVDGTTTMSALDSIRAKEQAADTQFRADAKAGADSRIAEQVNAMIQNAPFVEDVVPEIMNSDMTDAEKATAMEAYRNADAASLRQMPVMQTPGESQASRDATRSIDAYIKQQEDNLAGDQEVRVMQLADTAYADDASATAIAKRLGVPVDDVTTGELQGLLKDLTSTGLSAAQAAAVAEMTAQRGGWLPDAVIGGVLDGDRAKISLDRGAAREMAKVFTDQATRTSADTRRQQGEENIALAQAAQAAEKRLVGAVNYSRFRGNGKGNPELEAALQAHQLRMLDYANSAGYAGTGGIGPKESGWVTAEAAQRQAEKDARDAAEREAQQIQANNQLGLDAIAALEASIPKSRQFVSGPGPRTTPVAARPKRPPQRELAPSGPNTWKEYFERRRLQPGQFTQNALEEFVRNNPR